MKRYFLFIGIGVILLVLIYISMNRPSRFQRDILMPVDICLSSTDSIVSTGDSTIIPINYTGDPHFDIMFCPQKRKQKFIQFILPVASIARHKLMEDFRYIEFIEEKIQSGEQLLPEDTLFLSKQFFRFKTDSLNELKKRIYPHPVSIVIAQAALESGWGTSRFFHEGMNIFGVWSYSSSDKRIKASEKRGNRGIYVKAYSSYLESVLNYYETLGRVFTYEEFRNSRWRNETVSRMVSSLDGYSEEDDYKHLLLSIIKKNNLEHYDSIMISQEFYQKKQYLNIAGKFTF